MCYSARSQSMTNSQLFCEKAKVIFLLWRDKHDVKGKIRNVHCFYFSSFRENNFHSREEFISRFQEKRFAFSFFPADLTNDRQFLLRRYKTILAVINGPLSEQWKPTEINSGHFKEWKETIFKVPVIRDIVDQLRTSTLMIFVSSKNSFFKNSFFS